jgi:ribosomal protein L23
MTNNQMEQNRIKKQQEEEAKRAIIQKMTAKNGEVFYVIDGVLKRADNEEAYQTDVWKIKTQRLIDRAMNQMYFVEVDGINYGNAVKERKTIVGIIRKITDEERMMVELKRYFTALDRASKGGVF